MLTTGDAELVEVGECCRIGFEMCAMECRWEDVDGWECDRDTGLALVGPAAFGGGCLAAGC